MPWPWPFGRAVFDGGGRGVCTGLVGLDVGFCEGVGIVVMVMYGVWGIG